MKPAHFPASEWTEQEVLRRTLEALLADDHAQITTHAVGGQTEEQYIRDIIGRDWRRKTRYEGTRRDFAAYMNPILAGSSDKTAVPLCYYHAVCPQQAVIEQEVVDSRLSKYGSALILHLLHLIKEVLRCKLGFLLEASRDKRHRILTESQWHVTPCTTVFRIVDEDDKL